MTAEQVRETLHAQPFHPFIIHLVDGREFRINHRGFISQSPSGRTIIVYQENERIHIVDLFLVIDLEILPLPAGTTSPTSARSRSTRIRTACRSWFTTMARSACG